MSKQIQIRIFKDGRIKADMQGFRGSECLEYIEILEEMLQAKTAESRYTDEYFQKEESQLKKEEFIHEEEITIRKGR